MQRSGSNGRRRDDAQRRRDGLDCLPMPVWIEALACARVQKDEDELAWLIAEVREARERLSD